MPDGFSVAQRGVHGLTALPHICNDAVIVPAFDDPRDEEALDIIVGLLPEREAVSLPGHEVILNGGCFHCITQQQPAGVPRCAS